jgi:hypothetical protein
MTTTLHRVVRDYLETDLAPSPEADPMGGGVPDQVEAEEPCKRARASAVLHVRVAPFRCHPGPRRNGGSMKTSRIIPICLALTLAAATNAAAQHTHGSDPGGQHGEEHGPAGFFEKLLEWGYSEDEMADIHAYLEIIHQSIEEIRGLHDHEGPAQDTEEMHRAGEDALMDLHDAYESVVAELDEEDASAFTAMLFDHLLHPMAPHAHGEEGQSDIGGPDGHG